MDEKLKKYLAPLDGNLTLMDIIWDEFDVYYPNTWRSFFKEENKKLSWAFAWARMFAYRDLSPQEIVSALPEVVVEYPNFAPTLGQFIKIIEKRKAANRFGKESTPHSTFMAAIQYIQKEKNGEPVTWNPWIYWMVQRVGYYEVVASTWEEIKDSWSEAYQESLSLSEVHSVPLRLTHRHEEEKQMSKEEAKKILADIIKRMNQSDVSWSPCG